VFVAIGSVPVWRHVFFLLVFLLILLQNHTDCWYYCFCVVCWILNTADHTADITCVLCNLLRFIMLLNYFALLYFSIRLCYIHRHTLY
jgi:hypothetical protein